MEAPFIENIVQLGGTVTTTALFIWYLTNKNGKHERALKGVTDTLAAINASQEKHTRVLMNVSRTHGLRGDSEDLMKS